MVTLDTDDFEVSDIIYRFLRDPKTRPIYNTISTANSVTKVVRLNGYTQTYELEVPFVRTFTDTADTLQCDDDSATLEVRDHNGDLVTDNSFPWTYDGDLTITFRTNDISYEGIYTWASVGLTWYVIPADAEEPEIEDTYGFKEAAEAEREKKDYTEVFAIEGPPQTDIGDIADSAAYAFMQDLLADLFSTPVFSLPPNLEQAVPNEQPYWVTPPQEKEEIIMGFTQLFSFPVAEDPNKNKNFVSVIMAKEGEEGVSSIDPLFFEKFSFVYIDFENPRLNSNGQPAIFIQPRKEEDLGTYTLYYTYQELDSIERYKLEAVIDIILTPDVSEDAEIEEIEIPKEPEEFTASFGP